MNWVLVGVDAGWDPFADLAGTVDCMYRLDLIVGNIDEDRRCNADLGESEFAEAIE